MNEERRKFLIGAGSALSMTALATQARHFAAVSALADKKQSGDAANAPSGSDYRALVCILLNGGNDGNNTLVPMHSDTNLSDYQTYAAGRTLQGLAIPQNQLLPVTIPRLNGLTYGFHPSLGSVPQLGGINSGILSSLGTWQISGRGEHRQPGPSPHQGSILSEPVMAPLPALFALRPGTAAQSSRSDSPNVIGWGGRIADRAHASKNPAGRVPMITSIGGAQLFTLGQQTMPLVIKDAGTPLSEFAVPIRAVLRRPSWKCTHVRAE